MIKLGRNDPCFCGSGQKYKQCCLHHTQESRSHRTTEELAQKFLAKHPFHKVVQAEKLGIYKMSEILLEYGSDLLEQAETDKQKEEAVCLCVAAWNLSWIPVDQRPKALDALLEKMEVQKESFQDSALRKLLEELVTRRQKEYPFCNRFIHEFSVTKEADELRLNVLSRAVSLLTEEAREYLGKFFH
jgi:hypothetical protein